MFSYTAVIECIIVGELNTGFGTTTQLIQIAYTFGNILFFLSLADKLRFYSVIYCFTKYTL